MKKSHLMVCLLMIALACVASAYYWPLLPEVVPVHWNDAGEANGYGPRASYWAPGPGMMLLLMAACWAMPYLAPRRYEVDSLAGTYSYIGTPWTLASAAVWYSTHRMAAKLTVASGLLALTAVWLNASPWVLMPLMLAWAPLAAGYSLLLYKRLPH